MVKKILLGYEINTGEEISIKLNHLVVTGITQASGKTTCLNALINRGNIKAIIFKTKIGEKGITEGTIIPPFYKDVFDWEYASEIMEAHRKEKLKFERAWIIKYSKGANSLLEFKKNIDEAIPNVKRDLEKNVLITLQAYLDKILPELQYAPLSNTLELKNGVNIMDLERFKEETQGLIIRSVLKEVLEKEKNIVVVIPECWKYIPEKISSPVKRIAESYIRQGATNNNFLFLDSQDITGVSKTILKQISSWIMGYQSEINEIKRTLDQLPIPSRNKPKSDEIATLKLGQFYVASTEFTKKVYVCPFWLNRKIAKLIALGKKNVEDIKPPETVSPFGISNHSNTVLDSIVGRPEQDKETKKEMIELRNDFFNKIQEQQEALNKIYSELFTLKNQKKEINIDEIVSKVLQKIPTPKIETNFDKESIIEEILKKVPKVSGAVTYEIAPLEKIQKDFLEKEKQAILEDVSKATPKAKETLKFIESVGKGIEIKDVCLRLVKTTTGSASQVIRNTINELTKLRLIRKDTHSRIFPFLQDRIKNELGFHEATEQEIDDLYNHILMEGLL